MHAGDRACTGGRYRRARHTRAQTFAHEMRAERTTATAVVARSCALGRVCCCGTHNGNDCT